MIGGYVGQRPTLVCRWKILKMHTLGDAFSLILGTKSRAFRTNYYQVTSNKVMMTWSVDCFYCLLYNHQINVCTLIGQSAVGYYAAKLMEKLHVF